MKKIIFTLFSLSLLAFGKPISVRPVSRPAVSRPISARPAPTPISVKPKIVNVRPVGSTKPTVTPTPIRSTVNNFAPLPKSSLNSSGASNGFMYGYTKPVYNPALQSGLNTFGMYNRPRTYSSSTTLYDEFEREYEIARTKYKKGIISKETLEAYEKLLELIRKHI